jgi:hypothetical protein
LAEKINEIIDWINKEDESNVALDFLRDLEEKVSKNEENNEIYAEIEQNNNKKVNIY